MLKTKKRNILDNLSKKIDRRIEQDGGVFGNKSSTSSNSASTSNKQTKKKGLFSMFTTDCSKYNNETKCKKKSRKCKWIKETKCENRTKEDKKLGKKSREDEADNRSQFKNYKLYNTNIMCYYKFISNKKYPKEATSVDLTLTHPGSSITFSIPKNNDGWIRNFWHLFMSHFSWLKIFNRYEQRYSGKTEDEFGENGDKEGNLYEVYLEFGLNYNVAYRQFMEFIIEMHAGREKVEADIAIDKFFDNLINKPIGLEYYINRAKLKYIQDFKLENSKVFKTGDQALQILFSKDAKEGEKQSRKFDLQPEGKREQLAPVVDRTVSQDNIIKQELYNEELEDKEKEEFNKRKKALNKVQTDLEALGETTLSAENTQQLLQIKENIRQIVKSLKADEGSFRDKSKGELNSIIKDLLKDANKNSIDQNVEELKAHVKKMKDDFQTLKRLYYELRPESQAGGGGPIDISMNATGAQAQNIGDYAGEMANKVFQGKYGRNEAFAASRTPAISLLKNERPDEDFFDEAAKELDIDKAFISKQLTPEQIAEYRIIRSKGNLKYITPLDYFRWATGDTLRLREDFRYAKYNIRVLHKILKTFDGFCLSNLLFDIGDEKNPTAKDIADGYGGIVVKMRRDSITKAFKNYSFVIDKLGTEIKDEVEILDKYNKKMGDLADVTDISIENDIFRENHYRLKKALEERASLTKDGVTVQKDKCTEITNSDSGVSSNSSENRSTSLLPDTEAKGGKINTKKFRNYSNLHNKYLKTKKGAPQMGGRVRWPEGASYRFRVTTEGHFLSRDMFLLPPIMFTKNKLRCGEKILGEKSNAYFDSDCRRNPIQLFTRRDIKKKNYTCKDYRNPNIKIDHVTRYLKVGLSQIARKRSRKNCFRKDMIEKLEKGTNKYRYWGFVKGFDYFYRYDYSDPKERVAIYLPDNIIDKFVKDRDGLNGVTRVPPLLKTQDAQKSCKEGEGYFQIKDLKKLQEEITVGEKSVHGYLLESITKGDRQFMRLDYNDILVKATDDELSSKTLQNKISNYVMRQLQILELATNDNSYTPTEKETRCILEYRNILDKIRNDPKSFINEGIGKNIFFMEKKLKYVRLYLHKVRSTPFENNSASNWHQLNNKDVISTNNRLMLFMDDYFETTLFSEKVAGSIKLNFVKRFIEKIKELEKEIAEGDVRTKERVEQRRDRVKTTEKLRQEQVDDRSKMDTIERERDREKYKDYRPGYGFGYGNSMGIDMGT